MRTLILLSAAMLAASSLAANSLDTEQAIREADQYQAPALPDKVPNLDQTMQESREAISSLPDVPSVITPMPELFQSAQPGPMDIDRLVNQGQQLTKTIRDEDEKRYESQVLVFVSASMPIKTVSNYLRQTQHIDAAVVMRGLVEDSMPKTREFFFKVMDVDPAAAPDQGGPTKEPTILIDPTLYARFDVQQVPTIIVTESPIEPCKQIDACPVPVHHKVGGDVSLPWALSLVSRQIDSPQLKATLRPLIKDLERL